jgi:hypothetical protein
MAARVAAATATVRGRIEAAAAKWRVSAPQRAGAPWAGRLDGHRGGAPNRGGPTTVKAPEIDGAAGIQAIALLAGILLLAGEGARLHARRR